MKSAPSKMLFLVIRPDGRPVLFARGEKKSAKEYARHYRGKFWRLRWNDAEDMYQEERVKL